jgi:hypothetical protein
MAIAYPILGYVDFFVPTGFHEVNAPVARMVFVAVLMPMLRMPRGHVKIKRKTPEPTKA